MAARTGVPTLMGLAEQMCRYIVRFTPIIQTAFPSNPALQAALVAALAACGELGKELRIVRDYGD